MRLVLVILVMTLSVNVPGCTVCQGNKDTLGQGEAGSKSAQDLKDQIYFVLNKRNQESERWGTLRDISVRWFDGQNIVVPEVNNMRLDASVLPLLAALMRDRDESFIIRQKAVAMLPQTADPLSIDLLIEALTSDSRHVALIAIERLTFLLPIQIGVDASAPVEERREAAANLQAWWNANRDCHEIEWLNAWSDI